MQDKQEKDYTLVFCLRKKDGSAHDPSNLNYEQNAEICLGMKKRGFGAGKINGFGGKVGTVSFYLLTLNPKFTTNELSIPKN